MYIKRIFESKLENELNNYKLPIFISGARQVGKTTVIKKVLENKNYLYINLFEEQSINNIFSEQNDLSFANIISSIENVKEIEITNEMIIVIDEIQVNHLAFAALKTFNEAKQNKIIVSGSNVAPTLFSGSNRAYPVGQFIEYQLNPLSFSEFLQATNNGFIHKRIISGLTDKRIDENIHNRALELFDMYLEVGGMPNVVVNYILDNDYKQIQSNLYENYVNDFAKYANSTDVKYLKAIYNLIPANLGKENQSFISSSTGFQAVQLKNSFEWLSLSRMALFCYKTKTILNPLDSVIKTNKFKLFINDTGLLVNRIGYRPTKHQAQEDNIYLGQVCENYIATVLAKYQRGLTYYEDKFEIDYVFYSNSKLIAFEIKASTNTKSKALKSFVDKYDVHQAYKISRKNLEFGNYIYLPLYAVDYIYENKIEGYFL